APCDGRPARVPVREGPKGSPGRVGCGKSSLARATAWPQAMKAGGTLKGDPPFTSNYRALGAQVPGADVPAGQGISAACPFGEPQDMLLNRRIMGEVEQRG